MSADRPGALARLRRRVEALKADTWALALAARDPRVPWYAKAVAAITVAYALSPIDLIPDFIPVLGYLDDLVLVPLGIALAIRLLPPDVLAEHRLDFIWKQPPYEYVTDKLPVDVLTGDPAVRKVLESGSSLAKLEKGWHKEIKAFVRESRPYRFYR